LIKGNQNSLTAHLKLGLQGQTWKDTFLLYALAAIILLPIGLLLNQQYGLERTLQAAPFIAITLIIIGYAISYLPLRSIAARAANFFSSQELDTLEEFAFASNLSKVLTRYLEPIVDRAYAKERDQDVLLILLMYPDMNESKGKLHSLYQLYNECHYVIHESDAHQPAKIAEIESKSGALHAKLFGEPIVISLVTDLLEAAYSGPYWIYKRDKATEDIVTTFSMHAEKLVKLKQKLRGTGADTSRVKGVMDKFMIRIYRELYELLADEVIVQVNKKTLRSHYEAPRKQILLKSPLMDRKDFHNKPSPNEAAP
jgi:hypothetical protein